MPADITSGYTKIDLASVDFNAVPIEFESFTTQPTPVDKVKKIIRANELAAFGE